MEKDVLLEMMASILQEIYDEGYGSEFRPSMQNVLVAFNNRRLTLHAPTCEHDHVISNLNVSSRVVCLDCGETVRQ